MAQRAWNRRAQRGLSGLGHDIGHDIGHGLGLGLAHALGLFIGAALLAPAQAARISQVVPQGEVGEVRQVRVQFDADVVAAGNPLLPAPVALSCNGAAPAGDARWLDARRWAFDLRDSLPAGQRCTLNLLPTFKPVTGTVDGKTTFSFNTGAPVVLSVQPSTGQPIAEDQQFLLRLNGEVDSASVTASAWCEIEGLGERIPVRVIDGAARAAVLRALRRDGSGAAPQTQVLLACQRPLLADAGVRLVWGPGIQASNATGAAPVISSRTQRFQWKVRPRFLAEFRCERENARAPCLPLRPMLLHFNTPVPRAMALAARLQPAPVRAALAC